MIWVYLIFLDKSVALVSVLRQYFIYESYLGSFFFLFLKNALFYKILGDTELNDYMDSLARDPDKFITPHNADTGETILHLVSNLQPTFWKQFIKSFTVLIL